MNALMRSIKQIFCKHHYEDFMEKTESPDRYTLRVTVGQRCSRCGHAMRQIWTEHHANDGAIKLLRDWLREEGLLSDYYSYDWGSFYYCEFRDLLSRQFDAGGPELARQYIASTLAGKKQAV